jgi:hypothetical protein
MSGTFSASLFKIRADTGDGRTSRLFAFKVGGIRAEKERPALKASPSQRFSLN